MKLSTILPLAFLLFCGCSSSVSREKKVEFYPVAYRQLPPEPVYSRTTWSNLPAPIPGQARTDGSPYISPQIGANLYDSTLEEAIQVIARTIGYRWECPPAAAQRRVSVKQSGSVEEVLGAVERQAGVHAEIDRSQRVIRVTDSGTAPYLSNRY